MLSQIVIREFGENEINRIKELIQIGFINSNLEDVKLIQNIKNKLLEFLLNELKQND